MGHPNRTSAHLSLVPTPVRMIMRSILPAPRLHIRCALACPRRKLTPSITQPTALVLWCQTNITISIMRTAGERAYLIPSTRGFPVSVRDSMDGHQCGMRSMLSQLINVFDAKERCFNERRVEPSSPRGPIVSMRLLERIKRRKLENAKMRIFNVLYGESVRAQDKR